MSTVDVDPRWRAIKAVHGGYAVGRLLEQLERVDGFTLASASARFVGPVDVAPADVDTVVEHAGRSTATVSARWSQGDRPRMLATGTLVPSAGLPAGEAAEAGPLRPDELPDHVGRYGRLPFDELVDVRLSPASRPDHVRGVVRVRADDLTAVTAACVVLDVLPPGAWLDGDDVVNVPTIDFTLHLSSARLRRGTWFEVEQRRTATSRDWCVEESVVRDGGHAVAWCRQGRRIVREEGS